MRIKKPYAYMKRSTPDSYDRDLQGWRFANLPKLPPHSAVRAPVPVDQKKLAREGRNALRDGRITQSQQMHQNNVETALRIYNKAKSIKFELVEITIRLIFENESGYYHYNFIAKPKDPYFADGVLLSFSS